MFISGILILTDVGLALLGVTHVLHSEYIGIYHKSVLFGYNPSNVANLALLIMGGMAGLVSFVTMSAYQSNVKS